MESGLYQRDEAIHGGCFLLQSIIDYTPSTRILSRRSGGSDNITTVCGFVSLIQAGLQLEFSFGRSILSRKWVAKMTNMAVLAKMAKIQNDPKGLVFYN